ncbi:MAG: hypothetical protein ACPLZG_12365, partial [Thermoproteota archaeon]
LPSEASVTVTVEPSEGEETYITLTTDKDKYRSGELINIKGVLKFKKDDAPLPSRKIDIYANDKYVVSTYTDSSGVFEASINAPDVSSPTTLTIKAKFEGDLPPKKKKWFFN